MFYIYILGELEVVLKSVMPKYQMTLSPLQDYKDILGDVISFFSTSINKRPKHFYGIFGSDLPHVLEKIVISKYFLEIIRYIT